MAHRVPALTAAGLPASAVRRQTSLPARSSCATLGIGAQPRHLYPARRKGKNLPDASSRLRHLTAEATHLLGRGRHQSPHRLPRSRRPPRQSTVAQRPDRLTRSTRSMPCSSAKPSPCARRSAVATHRGRPRWQGCRAGTRLPAQTDPAITGNSNSSSTTTGRSESPAAPAIPHALRARSSTTGVGAQPIYATTTAISAASVHTCAPALRR